MTCRSKLLTLLEMLVGYFSPHILAMVRVLPTYRSITRPSHTKVGLVARRALKFLLDCSAFFVAPVQIATIIFLIRQDFGVSTSGMENATISILQAVSLLVLLPLAHRLCLPKKYNKFDTTSGQYPAYQDAKPSTEFAILMFCWLLGLCPFYSQTNAALGPSRCASATPALSATLGLRRSKDLGFSQLQVVKNAEQGLMLARQMEVFIPLQSPQSV